MEQKHDTTKPHTPQPQRPRQPRLRLPFDNRKQDFAGWIYDNRAGLSVTIIVFLVGAIVFIASKIDISSRKAPDTIYIDLGPVELEDKIEQLKEEIRQKQDVDWSSIRNRASNENALNENLEDTKGLDASEINDEAEAMERQMQANRDAFEEGMREVERISNNKSESSGGNNGSNDKKQDAKYKGNVTVSWSFKDPVRNSRNVIIPAYRCEGGGEVIIEAVLNQSGKVISATVVSGGDGCMQQTARNAALGSTFNIDKSAPEKHYGTITYIFIPQ